MCRVKCPRCGLINPDTAQRCDCGYDFASKKVGKPFYAQEFPPEIKSSLTLLIVINLVYAVLAVAIGDDLALAGVLLWMIVVYFLYSRLVQGKNWARIGLMLFTFPWGFLFLLSPEIRLYCKQRE